MTADSNRSRARQACLSCKFRKKKCNKALPSCSYCIKKDLECRYVRGRHGTLHIADASPQPLVRREAVASETTYGLTPSDTTASVSVRPKASLYYPLFGTLNGLHVEVQTIIQSTGQFVDDVTARYFQTFHRHLPIISRTCFQNSLIGSGIGPSADSSILLLAICLIAKPPDPGPTCGEEATSLISRGSLYLATKALLAQVQASTPPSIYLIQANLLVSIYEYASGRAEAAFISIATCVRMAYATRIHESTSCRINSDHVVNNAEAGNTWWGIIIYERAFFCELEVEQPLGSTLPPGDTWLPIEFEILDRGHPSLDSRPNILVSSPASTQLGGFARAAQATCLVDRVIKGLIIPDLDSRLLLLQGLDNAIQALLALVLPYCEGKAGMYCAPIAMAIRGLFMLHWHILEHSPHLTFPALRPLEEWQKSSKVALDTATKIVLDIAECHHNSLKPFSIDVTPPNHIYIVRAAIKHIRNRIHDGDVPWSEDAESQLQLYLDKFAHRWDAVYD